MKRTYVRATLRLDSNWRIGSWDTRAEDRIETLVDKLAGTPMIPGSGVAGGLRSAAATPQSAQDLFGPEAGDDVEVSPWWVLGTVVEGADVSDRRRVKIDRRRGAAAKGGLFAAEEVDGGRVRIYFRSEEDDPEPFLNLLAGWRPRVGGGRTTGLGRATVESVVHRTFDLDDKSQVFTLLGAAGHTAVDRVDEVLKAGTTRKLRPQVQTSLLEATVRCAFMAQPEDKQYLTQGSAWKGILRSRVEFIGRSLGQPVCGLEERWTGCGECAVCGVFGSTTSGGVWEFQDAAWTQVSSDARVRIAIDRFTGGARSGAWFKQHFERDVEMKLTIFESRVAIEDTWVERALLHALRDLDDGLITIGPEGASGYGRAKLTDVLLRGAPVEFQSLRPVLEEVV